MGMKLAEKLKYVMLNISYKKLRSFLTVLAIIFGIFTIIAILAVGQGLKKQVSEQLEVFGARTIFVIPVANANVVASGRPASTSSILTTKDMAAINRITEIEEVSFFVGSRADVSFMGQRISSQVVGGEPDSIPKINPSFEVLKGRMLRDSDRGAAFIGWNFAENFFDKKVDVNSRIFINDKPFTIVGVMKQTGTSAGGTNIDDMIIVHEKDARSLFKGQIADDEVQEIMVLVREGFNVEDVSERVKDMLRISRRIGRGEEDDFSLLTAAVIGKQVDGIMTNITAFLGAIAIVSLLVGGIGISNTMFTAVMERTREVGILKAMGASGNEILSLFVIESTLISVIGGMIGFLLAFIFSLVADGIGVPFFITPELPVIAFFFSLVVGVVSGYFPARRAARMEAVAALRS